MAVLSAQDQLATNVKPYADSVMAGELLFISGQLPIDLTTGALVENDILKQTHQSMKNLIRILERQEMSSDEIVKVNIYLKNIEQLSLVNEAYLSYFHDHRPARVALQVASLPQNALVEIDAVACRKPHKQEQ